MFRKLVRKRLAYAKRESVLSPLEAAEQIAAHPNSAFLWNSHHLLKSENPAQFRKYQFSDEYLLFYADNRPNKLVVCFTDKHRGLFVSVPAFLQYLGAGKFDVLFVHDKRLARHEFGIEGVSSSLAETSRKISELAREQGYEQIITYGCSMGGFSAIRAGAFISADRAISIGGTFWKSDRWFDSAKKFAPGYDPICDCAYPSMTEVVAFYCENTPDDVLDGKLLKKIMPCVTLVKCSSRKHNVLREIIDAGNFRSFLSQLFDLSRDPTDLSYEHFLKN
jgi:hypothetical protein